MSPDQEHVAGMAKAALAGLNATRRRLAANNGGVQPLLPIVNDAVMWLTEIANSGTTPDPPTTVDGTASGTATGGEADVVTLSTVDVATAAQRLGISVRAVRKRCAAGTLSAAKVGTTWLIKMEVTDA